MVKIGVSIRYEELGKYPNIYVNSAIMPGHIQISGLPAEAAEFKDFLKPVIKNIRVSNPDITFSMHAYKFNLAEKAARVHAIWVELAKDTIFAASKLEMSFVSFHLGYGSGGTRIRHQAYTEALVPVLQELVNTAASYGLEVHIENLYPRPIHSEICMLGDRVRDFRLIFDSIKSPFLKLCYDYGHGNIDEHGIDILRAFPDRLGSVHAHDNDQMADMHGPIADPASGTINWAEEFYYLNEVNFKGPFILESSFNNQIKSLENMSRGRFLYC